MRVFKKKNFPRCVDSFFPLICVPNSSAPPIRMCLKHAVTCCCSFSRRVRAWLWVSAKPSTHHYPCYMWEKLSCNSNLAHIRWAVKLIWQLFSFLYSQGKCHSGLCGVDFDGLEEVEGQQLLFSAHIYCKRLKSVWLPVKLKIVRFVFVINFFLSKLFGVFVFFHRFHYVLKFLNHSTKFCNVLCGK